jgi:hypothetical protein
MPNRATITLAETSGGEVYVRVTTREPVGAIEHPVGVSSRIST